MTHPDIVEYINLLHSYSGRSLLDCFNSNNYEGLYVFHFWLWIIAKIGDKQLLPATAVFFYYFCLFYVLGDYRLRKDWDLPNFSVLVIPVICMSQFAFILNSFRSYVAFAWFFLAVYRELVQGKKDWLNIVLYIAPGFLHISAFVLLFIRVIAHFRKHSWILTGIIILSARENITILAEKLSNVSSSTFFLGTLKNLIVKADMYFRWTDGGWAANVKNSGYYTLVRLFCLVIIVSTLFYIFKSYRYANRVQITVEEPLRIYCTFGTLYLFVTLETFLITAPECFRFVFPIIPYLYMYLYGCSLETANEIVDGRILKLFLIGMTGIGIFLNLYNLNTMFNLTEYFGNVITWHPIHF